MCRNNGEIKTSVKQTSPATHYRMFRCLAGGLFSTADPAEASKQISLCEHQWELTAVIKQGGVFVRFVQGFLWCGIVFIKAVFFLFFCLWAVTVTSTAPSSEKEAKQCSVTIIVSPWSPGSHFDCCICSIICYYFTWFICSIKKKKKKADCAWNKHRLHSLFRGVINLLKKRCWKGADLCQLWSTFE